MSEKNNVKNCGYYSITCVKLGEKIGALYAAICCFCCCFSCYVVSDSCDPVDWSPPGSSVCGISQARTPEWVAIFFSRGSSWPRDQTCIPCIGRWILSRWPTREAPGTWHLLSKCLLITWLLPPVPPLTAAAESPLCRLPCSHPALCCVRRVPCHHPLAFTALAVSQAAVWTRCVLRTVPGETLVPRPGTPRWAEPLR